MLDLRTRRVPNGVSVSFLVGGLGLRALTGGYDSVLLGVGGVGVGLGLLIIPFAFRLVGGADVKVMAGIGSWLGPTATLYAAGIGFIAGASLALVIVVGRPALRKEVLSNLRAALLSRQMPEVEKRPMALTVPHVAAYAIGGALTSAVGWGV